MALQGDLRTLELTDIVQNLEMHRRSGTLAVDGAHGTSCIYFREGQIALLAHEHRPTLIEDMVRAGVLAEDVVKAASKRRFGRKKPLAYALLKKGLLDQETFRGFAQGRLLEDVCDFLSSDTGAFSFTAESPPAGLFDPEEQHAELAMDPRSLLFEAARRKDHWPMIRGQVPSDAVHYLPVPTAAPAVQGDAALAEELLARMDGVRNVRAVMQSFPHRRFEAYELLAELVAGQAVMAAGPDDLAALARDSAEVDAELSWRIVSDGLDTHPHHFGLLAQKQALAEARGDDAQVVEALKVIAHLKLESGDRHGAVEDLARASRLAPNDPSIGERTLDLAIQDGQVDQAVAVGLRLAEVYRVPGLHTKARAVFERLVELVPDSWELRRELARAQVDCGDHDGAVGGLERHGKQLLAQAADQQARAVYAEILALVPKHRGARKIVKLIDDRVLEQRRARRRTLVRRAVLVAVGVPALTLLLFEAAARVAYSRAERRIEELELIESRRYAEAAEILTAVRARYPYTPTALFDVRSRVARLRAKGARDEPGGGD